MRNRDVQHCDQTRVCVDAVRDAVHDHSHRTDTAFDLRSVYHVYRRNCVQDYIVAGVNANLFRFDLLRVIHVDLSFAVNVDPALHCNACNLSCCCEAVRGFSVNVGYDRFHILTEVFPLPAESVTDHHGGFCEAYVTCHRTVCFSFVEFFNGDADTLFFHNCRSERRQRVDSSGSYVVNFFASSGPQNYQQVHDETRVDAGTHNGYAVLLCDFI